MSACSFLPIPMGSGQSRWPYFIRFRKCLETVLYEAIAIELATRRTGNVLHILSSSVQLKFKDSAISDVLPICWWARIAA